jgi:hypothetical protein
MALPKQVYAAKVQAVNEALTRMSPQELDTLPALDADDLRLFGAISQHYCFLDLNLRRALEIMWLAERLPPEHVKKYPDYSDASLTEVLRGSVEKMDAKVENLDESLPRLEEMGRCRSYRNLLNHFAGMRYPGEDVYVFVTRSDRDARKALGKNLADHHVHISVAWRSELFQLEARLYEHQAWLSRKIPEWDARYLPQ